MFNARTDTTRRRILGASAAMLARYQRAHPRLWARLRSVISEATGQADPRIPLVRLRLGEPAHGE